MKKILYLLIVVNLFIGCNDNFLEKYPKEVQTEVTAFKTYANFKTYAWGLYGGLNNPNILRKPGTQTDDSFYWGDVLAGYLSKKKSGYQNMYSFQLATVPASGGGFDFAYVRRVNLMLDNIDGSIMSQEEKDHWRSVGYFFRAYYYYELVARFGNVPWIEHVVKETDDDIIYAEQTPRTIVVQKMLENLQFAEQHIKPNGDGINTINIHTVRALISRLCLFEGTWRKYHNIEDAEKYLKCCAEISEKLMSSFPKLHPYYDEMFTSEDLSTVDGVILYKEYKADVLTNNIGYYERCGTNGNQMNKYTVSLFLCMDGKPISASPLYAGDKTMYDEMRNRDPRLLLNVTPPYRVNTDGTPTGNPKDAEYIEKMKVLSREGHKRLPLYNWSGSILEMSPNMEPKSVRAYMVSRSGYYMYKNYNTWDQNSNAQALNTADKPLFKIEEILLNYAEAKYELGEFDQSVADMTINKLRSRQNVQVGKMIVSEINDNFDVARDPLVPAVLWEIRRERIVELMGEGFGFYDIRRWKRAEWFLNRESKGIYIRKSDFNMANKEIMDPITGLPNKELTEAISTWPLIL